MLGIPLLGVGPRDEGCRSAPQRTDGIRSLRRSPTRYKAYGSGLNFRESPHNSYGQKYGFTIVAHRHTGWWFGTMEFYDCPFSWECHHPNWRSHSSEGLKPPTRYIRPMQAKFQGIPSQFIWPKIMVRLRTSILGSWNVHSWFISVHKA